jgi:hypothetical protein
LLHLHSLEQVQYSTPTSAVGVRLQFAVYVFQFCWLGGLVCPGAALDYFPGVWVGESHVVFDAHLFVLQFHTCSFGAGWWGEKALLFFSAVWHSEAFHGLGVQDVADFDSD